MPRILVVDDGPSIHILLPYLLSIASIFDLTSIIRTDLLLNIPYTSKSQDHLIQSPKFKYYNNNYDKPILKKTFFPSYAKSSKIINGNRYGRHINLERRVKGEKHLKWK